MNQAITLKNKAKSIVAEDIYGALNGFIEALEIAETLEDQPLQLEIQIELCYIHRHLSNMKDGFSAAVNAARLSKHLSNKELHIRAYNFMGIFCFYTGLYKRAINYFFYALEHFGDLNNNAMLASIYTNLGETYSALGNLNYALEYMEKSHRIIFENEIRMYFTAILCNLGSVYLKKNELVKAEQYFSDSYSYQLYSDDKLYRAELDLKLGSLYLQKNNGQKALEHLIKSEKAYRKLNNRFYLIDVLLKMSELTDQLDSHTRTACLYEAKTLAEITISQNKIAMIEFKLYELALERGDHQIALEHFKAYHEHSARSDVKNLLSKLEIMSIEQDYRMDNSGELDLQDFASMDIFGDYNVEDIIESLKTDLQYKAHTDDLTGLPNRRKINEKLKNMTLPQEPVTYGLLIIDIDHFKMVNDNEGHLYGDRCLIRVSKTLKDWSESAGHFVGRYGGEEFLCILENLTLKEVQEQAETIRQRIEKEKIPYNILNDTHHLTISIGGAMTSSSSSEPILNFLEKADQALYKAKSSGRNCVKMNKS